jgi:hypothetical protein
MHKGITALAMAATLATVPAQAATDMGLTLHSTGSRTVQSGIGAQASITVQLGERRSVKRSERLKLGIAAGPVLAMRDARAIGGIRQAISGMAGLSIRPGHSAQFSLAGQPVYRHLTRLGAAEEAGDEAEKTEKKDGKGPSTLGWIGIGVGALVAVTLVAGAIVLAPCLEGKCSD